MLRGGGGVLRFDASGRNRFGGLMKGKRPHPVGQGYLLSFRPRSSFPGLFLESAFFFRLLFVFL